MKRLSDRRGLIAWALYDWATTPFSTLIITFVFPAYFGRAVIGDEVAGQSVWGYAIGFSGLIVALFGPLLGAIADTGGSRKPWLLVFTLIFGLGTALLWFVQPGAAFVGIALACIIVANVSFEFSMIFNNAMLPDIVPRDRVGRWSGWAWALGFAGGLTALAIALLVFIQAETPPFGLDADQAENVRIVGPFIAVWLILFGWPLFVFTPDRASRSVSTRAAISQGLRRWRHTMGKLPGNRNMVLFLLAHMLYTDALVAVFAFGGIYAAGAFDMTLPQVLGFGILLNVAAGAGAFAFAWIDDLLGSRRTILIALVGLIIGSAIAVLTANEALFWMAGLIIGIFVGPAQAASRSLMARIAPHEEKAEYFGLLALSGKATAFVGPALVGLVTAITASQRIGLASLIVFLIAGLALLRGVRETAGASAGREEGA